MDFCAELDEAVKAQGKDPTGGRGRGGGITGILEGRQGVKEKEREVLESAV